MMFYHLEQLYPTPINKIIQIHWEDLVSNKLDHHQWVANQTLTFPSRTAHLQPGAAGLELDPVFPIQEVPVDSPQPLID
jgi:hypothetical protein